MVAFTIREKASLSPPLKEHHLSNIVFIVLMIQYISFSYITFLVSEILVFSVNAKNTSFLYSIFVGTTMPY